MTDVLRPRLARREWIVTVETVTPAPADARARARVLALAEALRTDDRVAALTSTDRTTSEDAEPVALASEVTSRSGKNALVHVAGKGRSALRVERTVRRAAAGGITSLLLTGGDPWPGAERMDALEMLALASRVVPALLRVAVLTGPRRSSRDDAFARACAKRDAGADAFIAQASWDLAALEAIAAWQAPLNVPVLGAVVVLTRHTLGFLDAHGFTGLAVPSALRARAGHETIDAALRRAALDLVALRRLGYAGVHLSGLVTPRLVTAVLDEATRLHAGLGDAWRDVWRDATGIA